MTDHKAGGLVRNAFSRKSKYLRRNTRESQWVLATPEMNDFTRRPQIVHPASFAPSERADALTLSALDDESPNPFDHSTNPYVLRRLHSGEDVAINISPVETERRHSSPVATRGLGIFLPKPAQQTSPSDGSRSPFHYDRYIGKQAAPKPKFYGLPANPKPGRQWTEFGRHKVVEVPQHKGWDEFRSPRASAGVKNGDSATSTHTPWPTSEGRAPQPAPQSKLRGVLNAEKVSTYITHQIHSSTPAKSSGKNARSQSNQNFMNKVHKAGTRMADVYTQGPKGEGQKLWRSLRGMRDDRRELRHIQTSLGNRSPRTQKRGKMKQKKQLDDIHAVILDFPASKPVISHPLPLSTVSTNVPKSRNATPPPKLPTPEISPLRAHPIPPLVPDRPMPLGVQRSPVIVSKPLPGSIPMRDPFTGSMASTSSGLSFDVPFTASRSVEIDSKVNVLKLSQNKNHVPILNAAPIPSTIHKKGLPPRPVLAPGEKEPPELKQQERMYKLRVGAPPPGRHVSSSIAPSRPAPVKGGNIPGTIFSHQAPAPKPQPDTTTGSTLAVGPSSHTIPPSPLNPPPKLSPFASLDDRQTSCRDRTNAPVNKAPTKHRFASALSHFFDVPTSHKPPNKEAHKAPSLPHPHPLDLLTNLLSTQDRAREKKLEKLKQAISAPQASTPSLASLFADSATPPIPAKHPKRNSITVPAAPSHSQGRPNANPNPNAPPVTPLPKEYLPAASSSSSRPAKPKDKPHKDKKDAKEKTKPWTDMLPSRKRADSGDSFACVDARGVTERWAREAASAHRHQPQNQTHEVKPPTKTTRRNSGFQGFQVWRGPVEVKPVAAKPTAARKEGRERFEEEGLVPRGLESRKEEKVRGRGRGEVRDTDFYEQVHSVIKAYGGDGVVEGERMRWI